MGPDPFNQVYIQQTDKNNKGEEGMDEKEKMEFGWRDVFALTLAAYQVLLIPFAIFAGVIAVIILLINILA
ncbi:MAG: hypothetical protein UMV23_06210 [Halanaerobium sp.]|nr:hypothetical protein [Halanaerobium sp.]